MENVLCVGEHGPSVERRLAAVKRDGLHRALSAAGCPRGGGGGAGGHEGAGGEGGASR